MEVQRAIGQRSYETTLLVERLKQLKPGELVSYAELSKVAGIDVHDRNSYGPNRLDRARKIVEAEAGFLVGPVAGEGIKRLDIEEQAALGPHAVMRMRRANRRYLGRLSRVEFDKLNSEQQQTHNLASTVCGVMELFTRRKSLERIGTAVEKSTAKLPLGDTLALFGGGEKK